MNPGGTALIGNVELRESLARQCVESRLHPCLLFEGPPGVGKASTARWLACLANCEADAALRPCGACWSCRQIAKGQHPDVLLVGLDPERTAPIISVEQARAIVSQMVMHPYQARRRFVILDPADALSPEAANALLKTFEEPPATTGFVLVSSAASRLLVTVRSRCQRVRFAAVPEAELAAWLVARGLPPELARLSDGCPGRALALADGGASALREARDALLIALSGGFAELSAYADGLTKGERAEWQPRVERALDALARLLVDAVHVRAGRPAQENPDRAELAQTWAHALGDTGLARLGQSLEQTRRDLEHFVNGRLSVEVLLSGVVSELGRARQAGAAA